MKEDITKSFEELSVFYKNWKRILSNQNGTIKQNIKDFFKYINSENTCYKELIKVRSDIKAKYNSELYKLNLKKEKLWNHMDTTKWEIGDEKVDKLLLVKDKNYAFKKMCSKETSNLNNLHMRLGFVNKMNMDELRMQIGNHSNMYKKNMQEFCQEFYPSLTDVSIYK